ncbi:MAG: hypothetical protein ABI681_12205 [Gemmatimonadales bacterium]
MRTFPLPIIGRLAITIAVVALIGLVFIALFFSVGGPFGTLNDVCVALTAMLSGGLVRVLYPTHRSYAPRLSRVALGTGLVGACLAAVGSGLVIFNVTGWFLAGLVTTFGYALIGLWLLGFNYSALRRLAFPRRLALFGIAAGGITAIGVLAGPGILARTDAMDSAQWFVSASMYAGGLGWNILYAIWCMWLGRLLLSNRLDLHPQAG